MKMLFKQLSSNEHITTKVKRLATVFFIMVGCAVGSMQAQVHIPATGCYFSSFTPDGQQVFEALAQKEIAIEMFYKGWNDYHTPDFPTSQCDTIVKNGAIPHITWEPWTGTTSYALDRIINGSWDSYIIGYAQMTKMWGKPLFIRLGHEMNGNWYPWGGQGNGGGTLTGFGDPTKPDGPERFVAAFRHVRRLFDSVGVTNVSWIWCPNNYPTPDEAWNAVENYYPGDDVVDWIGFDGYNWGLSQSWSGWVSFYDTFQEIYNKYKNSSKPLIIGEFASTEIGGDKAQWIRDAFFYIRFSFTRIKAITWFNINKETDWRINSSVSSLNAFREKVAADYFLSSIPTTGIAERETGESAFSFLPPSPNPANGVIRFTISIRQEDECALKIYNLLGQEIAEVARGIFQQGEHIYFWNARDMNGRDVSSGVYFALLRTTTQQHIQKVIIAR